MTVMPARSPHFYDQLGRDAVLALLTEEEAASLMEIEAKICDARHASVGIPIDPHHVGNAVRQLIDAGQVIVGQTPHGEPATSPGVLSCATTEAATARPSIRSPGRRALNPLLGAAGHA